MIGRRTVDPGPGAGRTAPGRERRFSGGGGGRTDGRPRARRSRSRSVVAMDAVQSLRDQTVMDVRRREVAVRTAADRVTPPLPPPVKEMSEICRRRPANPSRIA